MQYEHVFGGLVRSTYSNCIKIRYGLVVQIISFLIAPFTTHVTVDNCGYISLYVSILNVCILK